MASASDIHGTVFKNGSAQFVARVVGNDGLPIEPSDIASAEYTVFELDETDPDAATPIAGHTEVSLEVASLVLASLQTGPLWELDSTGYNFLHELDVSSHPAFDQAGVHYLVVFELTPVTGQIILVRFRVHAI